MLLHYLNNRQVEETEVVGILDDACFGVCCARCADADRLDIVKCESCLLDSFKRDLSHICADLLSRSRQQRLCGRLCDYLVVFIYDAGFDVCSAEVYSYVVFH